MRIPVLDGIIDREFESKPRKTTWRIRETIEIGVGERRGSVEIPCSLYASNLAIDFPDGFRYVVGDEEIEGEKNEKVRFKSCPEIAVELPDQADIPISIPIEFGLDDSIPSGAKTQIFVGILFLVYGLTVLFLVGLNLPTFVTVILAIPLGLFYIRRSQRTLAWFNSVEKERVEAP